MNYTASTFLLCSVFLLSACGTTASPQTLKDFESNPLMAEVIADTTIEWMTIKRVRADQDDRELEPRVLRAIDDQLIKMRRLRDTAHELQDAGKKGGLYGVNDNFAQGKALLYGTALYFGYNFDIDGAPEMRVYLANHPNPRTKDELFSEKTLSVGPLQNLIGPQTYEIGSLPADDWNAYKTVAIYSEAFEEVIALAQVRGAVR